MASALGYLVGALGDASLVFRPEKAEYCVEFEQKSKGWLEKSIAPRIRREFGKRIEVKRRKSGLYRLRLYGKAPYLLLSKFWRNKSLIMHEGAEFQSAFVRGFFDAEGSAPKRKRGTGYRISIYQKDRQPLRIISRILRKRGVRVGKITNSRDIGILPVRGKENIRKFADLIGSEHPEKKRMLLTLVRVE